ncbi:MAG: hypothetical protein DRK00_10950 [Thermoprotei archaeon]|nr:MAG: hypothetical protein DRK00_10950 [Thermoprotei archaeon]
MLQSLSYAPPGLIGTGVVFPGFRVFRVRVPSDARARLRGLLHLLNAAALGYDVRLPKGALRYVEEVRNVIEANLRSGRVGGGRRYLRGTVPALLLVNFVWAWEGGVRL